MRIGCHCVARSRHRVLYCINLGGATWQGFDIETQRKMEPVMMKKYHDELLKCAPASAPAHTLASRRTKQIPRFVTFGALHLRYV